MANRLPREERINRVESGWKYVDRWAGVRRDYTAEDVIRLRGSMEVQHTLADEGARKFWIFLHSEEYVPALGAMDGIQAVNQVDAGLKAIYVSGWQAAAGANSAGQMYPDQSLYPVNTVPKLIREINNALTRADQVQHYSGKGERDYFVPLIADAEAGFGGFLNTYELIKAMIEAGAAAIHLEDQLSSEKKCGHLGGKVLISTEKAIGNLRAARLAADVMNVPTVIIARTDADSATYLDGNSGDTDAWDRTGERTPEGFYKVRGGIEASIARGLAYAPYADVLWMETSHPNLEEARQFADAIHEKFPGKLLAYNCSPSFNWRANLSVEEIELFQKRLAEMGYKFQFVTLAGFHQNAYGMFALARDYSERGMAAYSELQEKEFAAQGDGYRAVKHQSFVGTGYFDAVSQVIAGGTSSTTALDGSTEASQFKR